MRTLITCRLPINSLVSLSILNIEFYGLQSEERNWREKLPNLNRSWAPRMHSDDYLHQFNALNFWPQFSYVSPVSSGILHVRLQSSLIAGHQHGRFGRAVGRHSGMLLMLPIFVRLSIFVSEPTKRAGASSFANGGWSIKNRFYLSKIIFYIRI